MPRDIDTSSPEPLTFDSDVPWHTIAAQWSDSLSVSSGSSLVTPGQAAALRTQGKAELERQALLYKRQHAREHEFNQSLLVAGTQRDRLNALSLMVSSAPAYHLAELQALLKAAEPSTHRAEAVLMALELLLELFMNSYLPDNRKLRFIEQRHNLAVSAGPSHRLVVLAWTVEDLVKRAYLQFIQYMETVVTSATSYPHVKSRACNMIATCLATKPESESILLQLLVGRLADRSMAGKILYLLSSLWHSHPNMTPVIIEYVWEAIQAGFCAKSELARSSESTKYYGLLALAQLPLDKKRAEWADRLVSIYLTLFQRLLASSKASEESEANVGHRIKHKSKKYELKRRGRKEPAAADKTNDASASQGSKLGEHNKLFSLVLKAIHRALPYASKSTDAFEAELEHLYRLVHAKSNDKSFQLNIETLWLLSKLHGHSGRYKRALYGSLLDERLNSHLSIKSQTHYCQLLKQVLDTEENEERLAAILKRLFQKCALVSTSFICAALALLIRALGQRPGLAAALLQGKDETSSTKYDPKKRDPEYSAALSEPFYEILPFLYHYHPSVKHLSAQVFRLLPVDRRASAQSSPAADPGATVLDSIESFSLGAFLDRFVYKNPKKQGVEPDGEPSSNKAPLSLSLGERLKLAPSASAYYSLPESAIPAHEKFFHAYFQSARVRRQAKNKDKKSGKKKKGKKDRARAESSDSEVSVLDSDTESLGELEDDVSDDAGLESDFSGLPDSSGEDSEDGLSELAFSDETELTSDASDHDELLGAAQSKKKRRAALPLLADADDYEAYLDEQAPEPTRKKEKRIKQR